MSGHYPASEFKEYLEALRRRGSATPEQYAELRRRWELWDRSYQEWRRHPERFNRAAGGWYVASPPPDWELLELEFAPITAPEADYELLNGPLGQGVEVDPASDPEPITKARFDDALAMLAENEQLRAIRDETGLSYRQVAKIRDYLLHPNQLGPKEGDGHRDGYALYRVRSAPGSSSELVALRKLRLSQTT